MAFNNLLAVLNEAGFTIDEIVFVDITFTDLNDLKFVTLKLILYLNQMETSTNDLSSSSFTRKGKNKSNGFSHKRFIRQNF